MENIITIIAMFALAFGFGFIYRAILKKFAKNINRKMTKNIDTKGRWFRAELAIILFAWAVMTTWSPILFFFSGFCLFETIFSWCGLYALLGKNSCPL